MSVYTAEIVRVNERRGLARPNMPILYITNVNTYNTIPDEESTTQQSPGSQPQSYSQT